MYVYTHMFLDPYIYIHMCILWSLISSNSTYVGVIRSHKISKELKNVFQNLGTMAL